MHVDVLTLRKHLHQMAADKTKATSNQNRFRRSSIHLNVCPQNRSSYGSRYSSPKAASSLCLLLCTGQVFQTGNYAIHVLPIAPMFDDLTKLLSKPPTHPPLRHHRFQM